MTRINTDIAELQEFGISKNEEIMVNTRLNGRYVALLLSTALAGGLSGLFHPIFAIRGALLGISLSLGIIIINTVSQKNLSLSKRAAWETILITAIITGGFGGIIINLFSRLLNLERELREILPMGIMTLVIVVCYSLTMHTAYTLRWKVKTSKFFTILFTSLAGGLCGLIRSGIILLEAPQNNFSAVLLEVSAPFSGIIFAVLWAVAVILCDPAWSFERWHSVVGSDNPE